MSVCSYCAPAGVGPYSISGSLAPSEVEGVVCSVDMVMKRLIELWIVHRQQRASAQLRHEQRNENAAEHERQPDIEQGDGQALLVQLGGDVPPVVGDARKQDPRRDDLQLAVVALQIA